MLYFDSRDKAREFARKKSNYKAVDLKGTGKDRCWGVVVLKDATKPEGAKSA